MVYIDQLDMYFSVHCISFTNLIQVINEKGTQMFSQKGQSYVDYPQKKIGMFSLFYETNKILRIRMFVNTNPND